MRFAGTWKQYSRKAISQLTTIAAIRGDRRYFRWPYHAIVMKIFEQIRSRTVFIEVRNPITGHDDHSASPGWQSHVRWRRTSQVTSQAAGSTRPLPAAERHTHGSI